MIEPSAKSKASRKFDQRRCRTRCCLNEGVVAGHDIDFDGHPRAWDQQRPVLANLRAEVAAAYPPLVLIPAQPAKVAVPHLVGALFPPFALRIYGGRFAVFVHLGWTVAR
jgi:hypothetical protein